MARGYDKEIKYEIVEHIAVLSVGNKGYQKEFNKVVWGGNNGEPRYDIRSWNEDRTKMSKGITLTDEELEALVIAAQAEL